MPAAGARSSAPAAGPQVAWVGGAPGLELAWARHATRRLAEVCDLDAPWTPWLSASPCVEGAWQMGAATATHRPGAPPEPAPRATCARSAAPAWPTLIVLATDAPGRWQPDDCIVLARRWPLAVIVAVVTTLGDGRRRSGPALPGVEEIAWNELPARLSIWLADLNTGLPGALGMPATARREERVLQMSEGIARTRGRRATRVAVAAPDRTTLAGLVDLVTSMGHEVTAQVVGRPAIEDPTDVVVWEITDVDRAALVWLQLLTGERPDRQVVVVTSFPRGDSALAALRLGARAVLGQPVCLEAFAGALVQTREPLRDTVGIGLGFVEQAR